MKFKKLLLYSLSAAVMASCTKEVAEQVVPQQVASAPSFQMNNLTGSFAVTQTFNETFETGTKIAYATGSVTCASGSWTLNDALIGNSTSDAKTGSQSVRIRNVGVLSMNFNVTTGSSTVTVKHAVYGTDGSSTWNLLVSTNGGSTYTQVGSTVTSSSATLATATFNVNLQGTLRFEIVKASGGTNRINIDEFTVNSYDTGSGGGGGGGTTGDNSNMLLGNPSGATTSVTTSFNNYLYDHTYYIDSYNRDKGEPNWTSWYVGPTSLGSTARQDDFRADTALPTGWYEVGATSYSGSGFDRGHNCPSADRTTTVAANSATFLMDNMIPQAPNNNQQTWANFENYTRSLVTAGNEVYVIMGSYGSGGTGSAGTFTTINSGHVAVPARIWKVVVVIPNGNSDLSRITSTTRVISIDTPNINTVSSDWTQYITTVKSIETATGYTLLGAVPSAIRTILENEKDSGTGTL
jgi:endonuclease G